MDNAQNIFIQFDTNGIKSLGTKTPSDKQVEDFTTINDQGASASGQALDNFTIYVNIGDKLNISVVPKDESTQDKVFVTNFNDPDALPWFTTDKDFNNDTDIVSFQLTVTNLPPSVSSCKLSAQIDTSSGDEIDLALYPKIRKQIG